MIFGNFTLMDLVCIIICGLLSLNGYRRGAINSLIRFGGFIASFIIARIFSPILAIKLIELPLFRSMIDRINLTAISENLLKSFAGDNPTSFFYKILGNDIINQSAEGLKEVLSLVIAQFISFGLIIILISILIGSLQMIFRGVRRVPIIGLIDQILGLGVGLIIGLGFCFLMIWLFNLIELYNDQTLNWLNYQNSFFYQQIIGIFLNSFN